MKDEEPPMMLDGSRVLEYAFLHAGRDGKRDSVVVEGVTLDTNTVTRLAIGENLIEGGVFLMHCNDEWSTVAAGSHHDPAAARKSAEHAYSGLAIEWQAFRELTAEEEREVATTRAFLREIASGEEG